MMIMRRLFLGLYFIAASLTLTSCSATNLAGKVEVVKQDVELAARLAKLVENWYTSNVNEANMTNLADLKLTVTDLVVHDVYLSAGKDGALARVSFTLHVVNKKTGAEITCAHLTVVKIGLDATNWSVKTELPVANSCTGLPSDAGTTPAAK